LLNFPVQDTGLKVEYPRCHRILTVFTSRLHFGSIFNLFSQTFHLFLIGSGQGISSVPGAAVLKRK